MTFRLSNHRYKLILLLTILFQVVSLDSCHERSEKKPAAPPSVPVTGQALIDSLGMALQQLKSDACLTGVSWGYIIEDYSRGVPVVLFEYRSTVPLIPASTQKILTTGAALEIFGNEVAREVTITDQLSINWRANRLLQKIGQKVYGKYDFLHGSKAVMEFWKKKGIGSNGLYICDGSGKSRYNSVSPKQLAEVLYTMTLSHYFPVFYNSLPLAGISGTMHKWMKGTPGERRVRAKTGSLAGVRSYTGYIHTVSGKRLIFAIIVNNYNCRTRILKKKLEAVMVRMAEL